MLSKQVPPELGPVALPRPKGMVWPLNYDKACVLALHFDRASKAFDRSPYGNHGTITGASFTESIMPHTGLFFNGINNLVTIPNVASLNPNYLSFDAWVRPDSWPNAYNSVAAKEAAGQGWTLLVKNNGKLAIYLEAVGGTRVYDGTGTYTLTTGRLYHLGLTFDGITTAGYVNGLLDGSHVGAADVSDNSATDLIIGNNNPLNRPWHGPIVNPRMWDRPLIQNEMLRIAQGI